MASLSEMYREMIEAEKLMDRDPPGIIYNQDPIVERVLNRVLRRSEAGLKTYGTSMLRPDVSHVEWLRHAQEEALDLAVYLERIIHDLVGDKNDK